MNIAANIPKAPASWSAAVLLTAALGGVVSLSLGGCASRPQVRVQQQFPPAPDLYTVQSGDTLSKIAMRYGLSYQDVAQLNNIEPPYIIYVSQRLRLRGSAQMPRSNRVTVAPTSSNSNSKPASSNPAPRIQVRPLPSKPQAAGNGTISSSAANSTPTSSNTANSNTVSSNTASSAVTASRWVAGQQWQWPVPYAVREEFNLTKQVKGLYFAGKVGDAIQAAADGEVVYANNGLQEYGNLVLIRHLNGYISAYAHNSRLLVRQGERVRLGQTVAEMGEVSGRGAVLEFQIRLNGKPVQPRDLLPTR